MEKSDIKALTFDCSGQFGSWREFDALYCGVSEGEGCGRIRGPVLGSVAGAAANRTVSGHACDAGA